MTRSSQDIYQLSLTKIDYGLIISGDSHETYRPINILLKSISLTRLHVCN